MLMIWLIVGNTITYYHPYIQQPISSLQQPQLDEISALENDVISIFNDKLRSRAHQYGQWDNYNYFQKRTISISTFRLNGDFEFSRGELEKASNCYENCINTARLASEGIRELLDRTGSYSSSIMLKTEELQKQLNKKYKPIIENCKKYQKICALLEESRSDLNRDIKNYFHASEDAKNNTLTETKLVEMLKEKMNNKKIILRKKAYDMLNNSPNIVINTASPDGNVRPIQTLNDLEKFKTLSDTIKDQLGKIENFADISNLDIPLCLQLELISANDQDAFRNKQIPYIQAKEFNELLIKICDENHQWILSANQFQNMVVTHCASGIIPILEERYELTNGKYRKLVNVEELKKINSKWLEMSRLATLGDYGKFFYFLPKSFWPNAKKLITEFRSEIPTELKLFEFQQIMRIAANIENKTRNSKRIKIGQYQCSLAIIPKS